LDLHCLAKRKEKKKERNKERTKERKKVKTKDFNTVRLFSKPLYRTSLSF
jgi:hypothetical protein